MKYLVLLLALTGCADQTLYTKSPVDGPDKVGNLVQGIAGGIRYQCQEEGVNEKLVWIPCEFRNIGFDSRRVCIQISYLTNDTSMEVATSRQICTPVLRPDESFQNYGVFIKNKRDMLTASCGVDLNSCRMVIKAL